MKKIFFAAAPLIVLILTALTVFPQTKSRDDILKEIEQKHTELAALEELFLAPSDDDMKAHAEFLRQPDTGLIRILPREVYESRETYKQNRKTIVIRGGGSYYSFTGRTHEYSAITDIGLEAGQLRAGFAGANYGMLISLGDVPLENISLDTAAVQVLASHVAAVDLPKARIEQGRTGEGTTIEGITYKNRMPVQTNSTFLVRVVNYSASDVLVAFRVVRVDTDGSAIILWKMLKKYPTPHLARNN